MPSSTSRISPITPPAPQPTSSAGASVSWTPSSVASGAARCAPEANTTARSHVAAAERVARRRRGLGGAEARVRLRREPAADAYAHRPTDLTPPRSRRPCDPAAPCRPCRSSRSSAPPAWARPRSRSRWPSGCAPTGEDPVAVSADALQLYAGLEILTGARERRGPRAARAPPARDPAGHRARHRRRLRPPRPRRDRRADRRGPAPDRRRRHRPVPARRARRARPAPAARPAVRASATPRRLADEGVRGAARRAGSRATRRAAAAIAPHDAQRVVRALELLDAGAEPPGGPQLWTAETRHPTLLVAPDDGARGALRPDRRPRRGDGRGRRRRRGAPRRRRRRVAVGAPGARLRGAAARRRRRHAAAHAPLRQAPAHLAAQAAGHARRSTSPAATLSRSPARSAPPCASRPTAARSR